MPQRMLGLMMVPPVALRMEKPTRPAAVAAPGPALEPEAPSSRSQGFTVWPPNQMSLSARAPRLSFARSTAPAAWRRLTTAASSFGMRLRNGSAPLVVGMPAGERRSFSPQVIPCRVPPDLLAGYASDAVFACAVAATRAPLLLSAALRP